MFAKKLRKRVLAIVAAGVLALPGTYVAIPASAAHASVLGNILGAVIGGAVARSELDNEIAKYNDTEEGRREYLEALKKQYGVNDDPALNARLNRIMKNLTAGVAAVDPSIYQKPYLYFVNKDTSFNAFCTLGHDMSVNTGLFTMLPSDDEVAFVIGHEMGHGQKNHPVEGARKSLNTAILGSAIGVGDIVTAIANNNITSKPQEREADALAFIYVTHTNYNPGAGAAVWQRVMDKSKSNSSQIANFLSTHPSDESRRDTYARSLHDYSGGHIDVANGTVRVNGKVFVTPHAGGGMSGAERSYFVAGNLAAAYHNGHGTKSVSVRGNTVMFGVQPVMTAMDGDEDAQTLAARLNAIK